MSNESAAERRKNIKEWLIQHRETYLRSGGVEGHILDLSHTGGLSFGTNCLIKFKGRKSGKTFITPLCYGDIGGEIVIIASLGGADHHPNWYLNILAVDEIEIQIATQAFRATWREPEGAERQKVWDFMVDCYPFYADYQAATKRQIPIVMLKTGESVPVFKVSDATGIRQF